MLRLNLNREYAANEAARKAANCVRQMTWQAKQRADNPEAFVAKRRSVQAAWRAKVLQTDLEGFRAQTRERTAKWRERNPERHLDSRLKRFGISGEDFRRMWDEQKGQCKVCQKQLSAGRGRSAVDHNHDTGAVRALLCGRCNTLAGFLEKTPELLPRLLAYIDADGKVTN